MEGHVGMKSIIITKLEIEIAPIIDNFCLDLDNLKETLMC